jgi:8-oxo-dGTP pyrophosphatase MutT (NUDIX family)
MPIHAEGSGFQWGPHGKVFSTRAGAERQAAAAHANGFTGDSAVRGAGMCLVDADGNMLFLRRGQSGDHPGQWCFPGGTAEPGEDPLATAQRECAEEIGDCPEGDPALMSDLMADDGVQFVTFAQSVPEQFEPELNDEHSDYTWAPADRLPEPLHPGVRASFAHLGMDEWDETKHPRADNGQFGKGGGGAAAKPETKPTGSAQPGGGSSVSDETDPAKPPKPGEPFIVYRVGSSGAIKNRNAGNAAAVGSFLQRLDDYDASSPTGAAASHVVTAYRVTAKKDFGDYASGSKGKVIEGDTVGRSVRRGEVSYSFPEDGYEAEPIGQMSVDEMRGLAQKLHGYSNFDDMGGNKAAETIREAFKDKIAAAQAKASSLSEETRDQNGFLRSGGLTPDQVKVEQSFYDKIKANPKKLVNQYFQRFGKTIDPDRVKMMSAKFVNDRKLAPAVHEPSSMLSKLIFRQALIDKDKAGDTSPTVFTAGGSGSGKSEAMNLATKIAGVDKDGLVFDSTMSNAQSGIKKIQEALDLSGAPVAVVYTNSPVEKAFRFNAKRARAVPASVLAHAHMGASKSIQEIAKHFEGNPRVKITVVNNFDGKTGFTAGTLADVPAYNGAEVKERLAGAAKSMLDDGEITQERYDYLVGRTES